MMYAIGLQDMENRRVTSFGVLLGSVALNAARVNGAQRRDEY